MSAPEGTSGSDALAGSGTADTVPPQGAAEPAAAAAAEGAGSQGSDGGQEVPPVQQQQQDDALAGTADRPAESEGGGNVEGREPDPPVGMQASSVSSAPQQQQQQQQQQQAQAVVGQEVVELHGRGLPNEARIPASTMAEFPFRTAFMWRVVEHVKEGGLAKVASMVGRGERAWVITPAFTAICQLSGEVQRLARLEDIEVVATQTLFKKKNDTEVVTIKFKAAANEPSVVLQLKQHSLNPPSSSMHDCLQVLASARQAQCRLPLRVEALPPDANVFKMPRLGPFAKAGVMYMAPQRKITMWAAQQPHAQTSPRQPSPTRAFHDADGGEELVEAVLPSPTCGKRAARLAEAASGRTVPVTDIQVGEPVRVKSSPHEQAWRVGSVADMDCGQPVVLVRGEAPRVYPVVERIYEAGVYRTLVPTHIVSQAGLTQVEEPGAQCIPEGTKLRVRELVDVRGDTWAALPSGRWIPAQVGGRRYLEFVEAAHTDAVHPSYGLNSAAYGSDPALEEGLEPVPHVQRTTPMPPSGTDMPAPITVMVRVRPPIGREPANSTVQPTESGGEIVCERQRFSFDRVLWSAAPPGAPDCRGVPQQQLLSQGDVMSLVAPGAIRAVLSGVNACVLAYGASGSGKTFTILGEGDMPGLLQSTLSGILASVPPAGYVVRLSFFELYAEKVKDLLGIAVGAAENTFKKHRVRLHPITGPYVEGVTQVDVMHEGIAERLEMAKNLRATGATHGNSMSSRSHAIMQVSLVRRVEGATSMQASCLSIVDLAGSERARRYRDDNMVEASAINLSLTVLRKVIDALLLREQAQGSTKARPPKPPYRESMLTFLLSESLGGNAVTTIIATVSPTDGALEDTLATLRYAARARHIVNHVTTQSVEEVAEQLGETSPRAARALLQQYGGGQAPPPGMEPPETAEHGTEVDHMWQHIATSNDGRQALQSIIDAVRQQERDSLMLGLHGTHARRRSPTPPRDERELGEHEHGAHDITPPNTKYISPVPPDPPQHRLAEDAAALERLARVLTSETYRMLSPSMDRASLERMPMHHKPLPAPHDPSTPGAAKSFAADMPTTLLAQDYGTPHTPISTRPGCVDSLPPSTPYSGVSPIASPSPQVATRLLLSAKKGSGGNAMRFGNSMRVVSDLLMASGQPPLADPVVLGNVTRKRAQVGQVSGGSPSSRLHPRRAARFDTSPDVKSPSDRLKQRADQSPPGSAWRQLRTEALRRTRSESVNLSPISTATAPPGPGLRGGSPETEAGGGEAAEAVRRVSPRRISPPRRALRAEAEALRQRVAANNASAGGAGGALPWAAQLPLEAVRSATPNALISQQPGGAVPSTADLADALSAALGTGVTYVPLPSTAYQDPPPAISQVRRRIASTFA